MRRDEVKRFGLGLFTIWVTLSVGWYLPFLGFAVQLRELRLVERAWAQIPGEPAVDRLKIERDTGPGLQSPINENRSPGTSPAAGSAPAAGTTPSVGEKKDKSAWEIFINNPEQRKKYGEVFQRKPGETAAQWAVRAAKFGTQADSEFDEDQLSKYREGMYQFCKYTFGLTGYNCEGFKAGLDQHLTTNYDAECGCKANPKDPIDKQIYDNLLVPLCLFMCAIQSALVEFGKNFAGRIDEDIKKIE